MDAAPLLAPQPCTPFPLPAAVRAQTISLGDVLKFSVSPSKTRDSLTTTAPGVPLDSSNLVGAGQTKQVSPRGGDSCFV